MKNYFSIRPGKYNLERFYLVNRSRGRDRLSELDGEVSEVTSLLKDNVDKVLTRGDKLDDIQQKAGTSNLSLNVVFFRELLLNYFQYAVIITHIYDLHIYQ